jgi:hypothetical protein
MIYEHLILMRDLMHSEGGIYVHIGPQVGSMLKFLDGLIFKTMSDGNE